MTDLSPIAAEVIDRLSRIETTLTSLDKTVRIGNGLPSLLKRVDDLESTNDTRSGGNKVRVRFMGLAMTLMVALLGASVTMMATHNAREDAEKDALNLYLQKQDARIQAVEIDIAVIMAGLKGDPGIPGPGGKPGAKGDKGDQGKKGGIQRF